MRTVVFWYDPEDSDQGTNTDFIQFDSENDMLEWLNNVVKQRPKIKPQAFSVRKELSLKSEKVTTRFVIDDSGD